MNNFVREFEEIIKKLGLDHLALLETEKKLESPQKISQEDIAELQKKLWQQEALIKRLSSHPLDYAEVLSINDSEEKSPPTATILHDGRVKEILLPADIKMSAGDQVKLSQISQIVSLAKRFVFGPTGIVKQVLDETRCSIDWQGSTRVALSGKYGKNLETGDRVVLDSNGLIILDKIGHEEESYKFDGKTNIEWGDIGGLEKAKQELREAIELPFLHPDLFEFHNQDPIKGILLFGPPGCGKTMLVKAAIHTIAKKREKDGDTKFGVLSVKGPEILDKYVGVAEGRVRQIFYIARKNKAAIFIDEAEALLNKRGSGQSSDIERTIVPAFLAEMDGLEISSVLVILATNRPDLLDPAITRDGRIDRKIQVERPDINTAKIIFNLCLKKIPLKESVNLKEAVEFSASELFSENNGIYEIDRSTEKGLVKERFLLCHLTSGAMIKGIVSKANSLALWRNIENETKEGMAMEDIKEAIARTLRENINLNHEDELEDFVRDFRKEIPPFGGIRKLKQATI